MFEGDLDAFLDSSKFQESPQLGRGISVSQVLGTNTHAAPNPKQTPQILEISNSSASNLPPSDLGFKLRAAPKPPLSSSKNENLSALQPSAYDFGESQLDSLGYSNNYHHQNSLPNQDKDTSAHEYQIHSSKNLNPNPQPQPHPNPNPYPGLGLDLPRNFSNPKSKRLPPKVPYPNPYPNPNSNPNP